MDADLSLLFHKSLKYFKKCKELLKSMFFAGFFCGDRTCTSPLHFLHALHDMSNDVEPHEFSDEVRLPLHYLALVSMGVGIFDNLDFERAAAVARRLGRYEFLFTAAPLRIEGGMGSPLNPIATF